MSLQDHLDAPRGSGALADWRHAGAAGGAACGDLVRVAVRVEGERVVEAGFDASGCAAARAAGSAVVELVEGAPFLAAARLTAADVEAELGGLLPGQPPRRRAGGGRAPPRAGRRRARRRAAPWRRARAARSWR